MPQSKCNSVAKVPVLGKKVIGGDRKVNSVGSRFYLLFIVQIHSDPACLDVQEKFEEPEYRFSLALGIPVNRINHSSL